jgi:hypothetical protein
VSMDLPSSSDSSRARRPSGCRSAARLVLVRSATCNEAARRAAGPPETLRPNRHMGPTPQIVGKPKNRTYPMEPKEVSRGPYKQEVRGSSPRPPTIPFGVRRFRETTGGDGLIRLLLRESAQPDVFHEPSANSPLPVPSRPKLQSPSQRWPPREKQTASHKTPAPIRSPRSMLPLQRTLRRRRRAEGRIEGTLIGPAVSQVAAHELGGSEFLAQ